MHQGWPRGGPPCHRPRRPRHLAAAELRGPHRCTQTPHTLCTPKHASHRAYLSAGDVQTAALVGCFVNGDQVSAERARRVRNWIASYRDILNVWQLWHERARFDVGRAQLHQRHTGSGGPAFAREFRAGTGQHYSSHGRSASGGLGAMRGGLGGRGGVGGRSAMLGRRPGPPDSASMAASSVTGSVPGSDDVRDDASESGAQVLAQTLTKPSQLYVRCHACGKSMALPNLVRGSASAIPFLSQQKPKVRVCVLPAPAAVHFAHAWHPTTVCRCCPAPTAASHCLAAPCVCFPWAASTPTCSSTTS